MNRRTFLPLLAASRLSGQGGFEAGAGKRLITPDPLLPVSGGMGAPKPATRKLGELMARAVVLRSNGTVVGIATVDLIGFPSVLGDRIRKLVPRIAADHILISATHTHSAPDSYAFPDGRGGHTASLPYLDHVVTQVAAALNEAFDRLELAELRVATGEAKGKIAYNYYAPDLYDRRVSVMSLRTKAGKGIATLVNYAVHPEVIGNSRGVLSPDLVGPLCDTLEAREGGVGLFVNGAQGGMVTADNRDLSAGPRDALRGYWNDSGTWEECERIGGLLASEALRVLAGAKVETTPELVCRAARVVFPVESAEMWAVVTGSPLRYPHGPGRAITTQMNYLKIGSAEVLTIPGEALPNVGFYLKRKLGGPSVMLFGLTNDAFGYILSAVDYQSFERYQYVSRVSLGEQTGEILIREALKLAGR
ncbi:MAG: hypothetical protein FJW36_24530 [Acidobacteria bacterium]|nr:hypothetical protein [Acidobacteriota bacterium]